MTDIQISVENDGDMRTILNLENIQINTANDFVDNATLELYLRHNRAVNGILSSLGSFYCSFLSNIIFNMFDPHHPLLPIIIHIYLSLFSFLI